MKNQWKLIPVVRAATTGLLAAMLAAGSAYATSVLDAPHNESHDVHCSSCHSYSLWWQFSPTTPGTAEYDGRTDDVCNKCHGASGSEFRKLPHSAFSMGDSHNTVLGDWSTKCIDCHDPHLQAQFNWLSATATFGDGSLAGGLYLAEGTIGAITDNNDGTTAITFTNAAAKAPWQDTERWSQKSGNTGRGLLISLGYTTGEKTYEIISASTTTAITNGAAGLGEGTITVQSGSDPIDSGKYTGSNFGIIYGQLVKSSIATPNSGAKSVKFFDSQDGLVDSASGATTEAICQVCHTQTHYWKNDGTLTSHNDGSNCTSCHTIAQGFKPNYPDHDEFIAKLTSCVNCHTQTKVVEGIHQFDCNACHAASGPPDLKTVGSSAPFRKDPLVWPTLTPPTANGNCGECHGADYFDFHQNKNNHTGQVDKTVLNCTNACHFHNKTDTVVDIHKNQCTHCHNMTPNADGSFGTKISLAAQYGPGDCINCHQIIADDVTLHLKANDHVGQVDRAPNCLSSTGCHPGNTVFQVHPRMCITCHEPTYFGLKLDFQLYGITKAVAITAGTCINCHSQRVNDGHHSPGSP
ncbi:MAG: hypothetical protein KKD63_10145 [Proteobacteria bacterium]|nr:hypothetical protein [Pseudomonadota bacterium]